MKMPICEICWADAYRISLSNLKPTADNYSELVKKHHYLGQPDEQVHQTKEIEKDASM